MLRFSFMPRRRQLLLGAMASLVSACRPVAVLNAVIPTRQLSVYTSIAYGALPRQALDVYVPKNTAKSPLPVVLFFYGGSWDSGNKQDYLFVAEALCSQGFVVVIADYRVYPAVTFPALMQDPASALNWVINHIAQYQGDPNRLFLLGHSAGAHLATLLSMDAHYLAAVGLTTHVVRGVIGLAGPYDFLPLKTDRLKAIFVSQLEAERAQPIRYASPHAPPMFLLAGLQDDTVWPRNSLRLGQAITEQGGAVTVKTYPRYHHIDMVAKLAKPLRGQSSLLQDIVRWMREQGA